MQQQFQFSLRALLAAPVFAAAVVALWGTRWGRMLDVAGVLVGGIALIFAAARIYERNPGTTWPVLIGFLGVIVILAALFAWAVYVTGGYASA